MHCEGKLKLRSHNTSYCFIEVVTKVGMTLSIPDEGSSRNALYTLN